MGGMITDGGGAVGDRYFAREIEFLVGEAGDATGFPEAENKAAASHVEGGGIANPVGVGADGGVLVVVTLIAGDVAIEADEVEDAAIFRGDFHWQAKSSGAFASGIKGLIFRSAELGNEDGAR